MILALTRPVSPSMADCELTYLDRVPIDPARAAEQHAAYCAALQAAGVTVQMLPAAPDLPDAVFVEDMAVVVDEVAVITRPGAASRRPETVAVADALAAYRPVVALDAPATLDGGDVLHLGRTFYVGTGGRSNAAGVEQLRAYLAPHGYRVEAVTPTDCLHLKSACTALDDETVLINPDWIDPAIFAGRRVLRVAPGEPWAANTLAVNGTVLFAAGSPRTQEQLTAAGYALTVLDIGESQKAEGALTCQSILLTI